jgi:hypothetical protein
MMKAILLTFSVTLTAIALAASLFFNTLLGAFGLTMTSIDALQNLKTSQLVAERMKKRHEEKKIKTTKKYATRASKRVASTALAAATIGTVAVVATMTYFEITDYCEEKQDLQEDANILYQTEVTFDFDQCIQEGKKDSVTIMSEVKESSITMVSSALNDISQYSINKWADVKDASLQALQSTGNGAGVLWDSITSWLVE